MYTLSIFFNITILLNQFLFLCIELLWWHSEITTLSLLQPESIHKWFTAHSDLCTFIIAWKMIQSLTSLCLLFRMANVLWILVRYLAYWLSVIYGIWDSYVQYGLVVFRYWYSDMMWYDNSIINISASVFSILVFRYRV